MGLFSSIGKVVKSVGKSLAGGNIAGSLVSGGLSLLGGNIARNTAQSGGMDLGKLTRDADKYGINRLTLLGMTGGQGYQREFNPALSSGAFIQQAIERGADTYFNTKSQRDAELAGIREREELAAIQSASDHMQNPYQRFGYNLTQQAPFQAAVTVAPPPLAATPRHGARGTPASPYLVTPAGRAIPAGRGSDAEGWETRYGDIASEVAGLSNVFHDLYYQWADPMGERFNVPKRPKPRPPALSRSRQWSGDQFGPEQPPLLRLRSDLGVRP